MKSSKRLEFEDDVTAFVFKPKNPLTRQSKKIHESNVELGKIEEAPDVQEELIDLSSPIPEGDKNKVFSTQTEKASYKEMEERLRAANNEISRLRMRSRRHAAEKIDFKRIKSLWEVEKVSTPEIVNNETRYLTWNVPAIKESRFVRRTNAQLRATNRRLKRQFKDLEIQLTKSEERLQQ